MTISAALAALTAARSPQGGWGWRPAAPGNTECTALAALALNAWRDHGERTGALDHAVRYLFDSQRQDGSWPHSEQVPGSSWMTSLGALALSFVTPGSEAARRGGVWLLESRSRAPSVGQRLRQWLSREPAPVDQDNDIIGWSWAEDTAAWVEPTAWALLALKQVRPQLPRSAVAKRIADGHRLLADRMCTGGGWNHGNRAVLGSDLDPYPDTTALALIALQDQENPTMIEPSITRLLLMMDDNRSALVSSLAIIALQLHGHRVERHRKALLERLDSVVERGDTRSLALTLLAADEREPALRLASHA